MSLCLSLGVRPQPAHPVSLGWRAYAGHEYQPSLSPDGERVVFVWDENKGASHIYTELINSQHALAVTQGPSHDINPAWSPEGTNVPFLRVTSNQKQLMTVPSLGGAERVVCSIAPLEPGWVEDAPIWRL